MCICQVSKKWTHVCSRASFMYIKGYVCKGKSIFFWGELLPIDHGWTYLVVCICTYLTTIHIFTQHWFKHPLFHKFYLTTMVATMTSCKSSQNKRNFFSHHVYHFIIAFLSFPFHFLLSFIPYYHGSLYTSYITWVHFNSIYFNPKKIQFNSKALHGIQISL